MRGQTRLPVGFGAPGGRALPLTALVQQITISDEYRTRPRRAAFDSKTHAKERIPQWRDNGALESTPHD